MSTQARGTRTRIRFTQVVIAVAGLAYIAAGVALLVAPEWFFAYFGNFPPFNRHYAGDVGAFVLPLGAALLAAARDPWHHRLMVLTAMAASLLHAINHVYDAVLDRASLAHWLRDTVPLLVLSTLLILLYRDRPSALRTGDPRRTLHER